VNDLAVVLSQARYNLISLGRNRQAILFQVALPVFLLILFASVFGKNNTTTTASGATLDLDAYFTAGMMAYALTGSSFTTLAIALTTLRETGQLKRFRGTPIPSWAFIVSLILRSLALVAAMVVVLGLVAHFAYGVDFRAGTIGELILYLVLGTFTMCTLGIALSCVTTSVEATSAVAPFSIVILSFISGVFIPTDQLPNWLVEIGKVFPLAHLASGLQDALVPGSGSGVDGANVAILAGWGIAGLAVAARRFRWEPRLARG
jgi:ABC-2 type transport system permease protein